MKWNNKFLSITAIISPLCLDTSSCCVYYTFKLSFTTCSLHKKSLSLRRAANCTCAPFSCTQSLLYIPKVNCCSLGDHTFAHVMELYSPQMIPNRKWSRDRKWSPKWTANDPRPQVTGSLKLTADDPVKTWGMEWILWDWLQKRTDYKKRSLFLAPSKGKGKKDASSQVNLYKAKKKIE